jgi:hypothetical protein
MTRDLTADQFLERLASLVAAEREPRWCGPCVVYEERNRREDLSGGL